MAPGNEPFGAATISLFQPIFTVDNPRPPVPVPLADFYLGIYTNSHLDNYAGVYGWALVRPSGTTLTLLDSAMAYHEQGIFIGTLNAVPEPTSLILLGSAGLLLGKRSRRK